MVRLFASATPFLFSLLWALPSAAQPVGERGWGWHMDWSWGHMFVGGLMMILFWGGLIVLLVLVVRWLGGAGSPSHGGPSSRAAPLQILRERFARGEIDEEEYEQRRKRLSE